MGNPTFAVASLRAICDAGFEVVAVITGPDKPAGRGLKMNQSPVKEFALDRGLKILQPEKLKSPEFIEELKNLKPDLGVVIAFKMLPEVVWSLPRLGTINLHASLLPQYRGAAPINWAIINGESETGLSTFFLKHEIDTGKLIFSEKVSIGPDETAGELHDRMMVVGATLLIKSLNAIAANNYPQVEQENSEQLKTAPKIYKETCVIDWNKPVKQVYNHIRGLSPHPAAYTLLSGKVLKVFKSGKEETLHNIRAGTFIVDGTNTLKVAVKDGFIHLFEVQPEGRKRMTVSEFIRGYSSWIV